MKQSFWLMASAAIVAAGCSDSGSQGGAAPAAPGRSGEIRQRTVADLPKVGDYLPPIDEGRVEVAPPADWKVRPRGRTYLMAFGQGDGDLPRITINAETPPEGSPENLAPGNIDAFIAIHDAELRKSKRKVEEPGLAIELGDKLFVRHVRRAETKGTPLVVQSLQTIRHGRLYTVELIAAIDAARAVEYEESLKAWRDHGYAVAANMRFAKAGERIDPLAGLDAEPKQPPAGDDKQPADDDAAKADSSDKEKNPEAAEAPPADTTEKNPVP